MIAAGSGCGSGGGGVMAGQHVATNRAVYVAPIKDVVDTDGDVAAGSGNLVSTCLRDELTERKIPVVASPTGDCYVMRGTITHWEDHATEWNFSPDKVGMSLEMTDGRSRELVAEARAEVTSSALEFVHAEPDRLAPQLAREAIKRVYKH
jgi:hypothetical protein